MESAIRAIREGKLDRLDQALDEDEDLLAHPTSDHLFIEALAAGSLDATKMLARKGAHVGQDSMLGLVVDQQTALHAAAHIKGLDKDLLNAVLETTGDVIPSYYRGKTALDVAAWKDNDAFIRLYFNAECFKKSTSIAKSMETDALILCAEEESVSGDSPLHVAARHGSLAAARALLEAGFSKEFENSAGKTPAQVARERGHAAMAALLAP